jgi:uncharacterized phage protein (TIGR02218 family)
MTVDNLDVTSILDDNSITIEDLRAGAFDYASVFIFAVDGTKVSSYAYPDAASHSLNLRAGKFGECTVSPQGYYQVEIRGMTQLLQQQIGELYGPTCRADLFDARCGLSTSTYTSTATVASVTDATHFMVTLDTTQGSTDFAKWFKFGTMQITSGKNNGRALDIKSWDPTTGAVELYMAPGYPIVAGVHMTLIPGCDKTWATCHTIFHNDANFRGEANLPGDDSVFWYPDVG